ncbi:MAG: LamG domain-containing protein [Saprospiraceae bacterium]
MRNLLLLCFLLTCTALRIAPSPIGLSPADGLIAYYSFDHCDARDDTQQGSDGILHGTITCRCGVSNNGIYLNGIQDYVSFQGKVNQCFNTTDFSLSFYFKPSSYVVYKQSLLSKRDSCDQNKMLDIRLNLHQKIVQTEFYEHENKSYPDVSPDLPQGDWFHFALVREGIWLYSYLNGELQKKARRCSGVDISNEAWLALGHSPCIGEDGTRGFKGVIDELSVYDRALSEVEIAQCYARFPVETAEVDCVSWNSKKNEKDLPNQKESEYLCSRN